MTYPDDCRFKDAAGRSWIVVQTITTPKGERVVLLKRDKPLTNLWVMAIDNLDGTITIVDEIGPKNLYCVTRDNKRKIE